MNLLNLGYDSTNYYALAIKGGFLLVDCGWPGTLPKLLAEMKRKGLGPKDILYILATHFHPDHAGILQDIKDLGAQHILMESQPDFIAPMVEQLKRKGAPYIELHKARTELLAFRDSPKFLNSLGLPGEIIPTPGHSDDSVTLILDQGCAFTGDLPPEFMLAEDNLKAQESWKRIRAHKITQIYPAHGQ